MGDEAKDFEELQGELGFNWGVDWLESITFHSIFRHIFLLLSEVDHTGSRTSNVDKD